MRLLFAILFITAILHAKDSGELLKRGNAAYSAGKLDEAMKCYDEALVESPENPHSAVTPPLLSMQALKPGASSSSAQAGAARASGRAQTSAGTAFLNMDNLLGLGADASRCRALDAGSALNSMPRPGQGQQWPATPPPDSGRRRPGRPGRRGPAGRQACPTGQGVTFCGKNNGFP